MAKLALKASPTFPGKVKIPVAGGPAVEVAFVFKHRTREELDAYLKALRPTPPTPAVDGVESAPVVEKTIDDEVAAVMDVATGWEMDEPFIAENVREFLNSYHKAAWAIGTAYITELMQAREGN